MKEMPTIKCNILPIIQNATKNCQSQDWTNAIQTQSTMTSHKGISKYKDCPKTYKNKITMQPIYILTIKLVFK